MAGEGPHRPPVDLTVRLLGAVEVRVDGELVDVGGTLPRALVAHLALDADRIVPVDRLITRLWHDDPPRSPLGSLQSYVSRLRKLLEPGRDAGAPPVVLRSEAPGYRLAVAPDRVDVHRFSALAEAARSSLAAGDPASALAAADGALAVWQGAALAGIGPDEQVGPLAVRFAEQHAATVEDRFDALLALGRHHEAVPALQGAADDEPTRERRWALLATALYRSGRQADALRCVATVRNHLLDQLGLDLGPELRALERRILEQDPSLLLPPSPAGVPPPARPAATPAPPRDDRSDADRPGHLVGRHEEWGGLTDALDRGRRGPAQVVLLEGEAGIGKSTLVDALGAHARAHGWRVAVGRCVEPGLAPSLWPALEIVRALVDHTAPAPAAGNPLLGIVAGGDRPARAPTTLELVTAFVDLLDLLDVGPLLVVLDDAHWADQGTLDVLTLAAQRLGDRPVVVVVTFRPPEQVPGSLLAGALGNLRRLPALQSVAVTPLQVDEVAELMTITSGAAPAGAVAEQVQARTGGNPLFVVELARLAGERGVEGGSAVPPAIRDVVRQRLAQLPERATAELEIAAVAGERFTLQTVMAASDRSPTACLDALDAAIVTGILVPDGSQYRFAHALVRDAVLADIGAVRRQRLHAVVADAIAATLGDGPDTAEVIAHHRLAARSVLDPLDVCEALVRAADVARWKNALDEGEQLAHSALDVVESARRGPRRSRAEISAVEGIVSAAFRRGLVSVDDLVADVERIAARCRSDSIASVAIFLRFGCVDDVEHVDEVADVVREARVLLERTSEPYAIVTLSYVVAAWTLLRGGIHVARPIAARGFAASGSADPDDPPDHVPLVTLPMIGGLIEALAGSPETGRDHIHRRMRAWMADRNAVDATGEAVATFAGILLEAIVGDTGRVHDLVAAYTPVGPRGLFLGQDALVDLFATWAVARDGGSADVARADRAMAVLDDQPELVLRAAMQCFRAEILLIAGDHRATDALAAARAGATRRGEEWWLAEIVRLQAVADAQLGDGSRVRELLGDAAAIAARQGADLLRDRIAATATSLTTATAR